MSAMLVLMLWSALFVITCYVSWKKIVSHIKVYLLIFYNAIYLAGVFLIFSYIKA